MSVKLHDKIFEKLLQKLIVQTLVWVFWANVSSLPLVGQIQLRFCKRLFLMTTMRLQKNSHPSNRSASLKSVDPPYLGGTLDSLNKSTS